MTEDFRDYRPPQAPDSPKQAENPPKKEGIPENWASEVSFDEARRIYVKTNYDRYHEAFEKCDAHGGIQPSFSVAAFFFGWLWFFYRKMYREGLLILGFILILNFIGLSQNVLAVVSMAISTSLGIFGKGLYWMAVNRKIARAMELSPTNPRWALDWLSDTGGVNIWAVIGGIILTFLLIDFFLASVDTFPIPI